MKRKLQIFVSSTYSDLINERQAAVEAILRSGNIPAGMELFAAGNESQLEIIKRWIDQSDVYMVLLGGRYGSIDPKTELSYTEIEYRYAIEQGKPLFGIVMKEGMLNKKIKKNGKDVIEIENQKKYRSFRELVCSKICRFFENDTEIKLSVLESILDIQNRFELKGWVREEDIPDTKKMIDEIQKLNDENTNLEQQIAVIESGQLNKIGEYAYEDLKNALMKIEIKVPKSAFGWEKDWETNALSLFDFVKKRLAIGITNKMDSPESSKFLVRNLVAHLRIYDLAEIVKVPNVAWSKFQTSRLGNKFLAIYSMEKDKVMATNKTK